MYTEENQRGRFPLRDILLKAKLDGIVKTKEDEILFIKKEYGV